MSVQLYMKRIRNATHASIRAESPKFRELWQNIAHECNEKMIREFSAK